MRVSLGVFTALSLTLSACRDDPPAPSSDTDKPTSRQAPSSAPAARPAAASTESADEVQLETLLGVWRVVGVLPGADSKLKTDDPRVVGALMDVYPDKLSWSYTSDEAFAPDDLCLGPVSGLIAHPEIAAEVRAALAPARLRAGIEAGHLSRPHQWLCGDGGSWGDDAEFQQLGRDRLAMRWPGDLTLILERIRRASADPPALPPTGAYEER